MRLLSLLLISVSLLMAGQLLANDGNLIKDPGFEDAATGGSPHWSDLNVAVFSEKTVSGKYCLELKNDYPNFLNVKQQISLKKFPNAC